MEDKIFLDTDFLADFLRNKDYAISFMKENEKSYLCISIISLFELFYGAFKSQVPKKVMAVEQLASRVNVFGVSQEIAKEAGRIYAGLEKQGKIVEFKDILIRTTALIHNGQFKTTNVKHFERIKDLKIV